VPTLNAAEEGTLKGQLIKLGMYTIAASFEVEAERAAKDETPYAAYLARLIELDPAYCDTILCRFGRVSGKQATHAASGTSFEEVAQERATSPTAAPE